MLKRFNMGLRERTVRLVISVLMGLSVFILPLPTWALALIGVSALGLVLTGAVRFCVIKAMVGIESHSV